MKTDKNPASPEEWVLSTRELRGKKNLKGALGECRKGLTAFPDSTDLLYTYAELRVACFNMVKKPEHLKIALSHFEKLLKIEPYHYMANLLSAQIYYKSRAYNRAKKKIDAILKFLPKDPKALKINAEVKALVKKAELTKKKEDGELNLSKTGQIKTENIEGLEEAESADYKGLISRLSYFNKIEGLRTLHLIDSSGITIKSKTAPGSTAKKTSAVAADIFRSSGFCTRKLGLGKFQRGQIVTPNGSVLLVNVFYGILVLVVDPKTDLSVVNKRINLYIEELAL